MRSSRTFDGVPGSRNRGATCGRFTYRVHFREPVYWYHPHHRENPQILGLTAACRASSNPGYYGRQRDRIFCSTICSLIPLGLLRMALSTDNA